MIFIYSHKFDNKIRVLSDTKITIAPDKISWFSKDEYESMKKYGMIKTIIYKPGITISSTGNIEDFNELLENLNDKKIYELKKIIFESLSIHKKYKGATDFIITDKNTIYTVKNGKVEFSLTAWIGDKDAFDKFQELKLTSPSMKATCIDAAGMHDEEDLISPIDNSFEKIIKDRSLDTIGGSMVRCLFDQGKYRFLESYGSYTSFNSKQVLLPEEGIIFENNVEDGGFSYSVFNYEKYYAVSIEQSKKR